MVGAFLLQQKAKRTRKNARMKVNRDRRARELKFNQENSTKKSELRKAIAHIASNKEKPRTLANFIKATLHYFCGQFNRKDQIASTKINHSTSFSDITASQDPVILDTAAKFEEEMDNFVNYLSPSEIETKAFALAFKHIYEVLTKDASLDIYGSTAAGLSTFQSDLNITYRPHPLPEHVDNWRTSFLEPHLDKLDQRKMDSNGKDDYYVNDNSKTSQPFVGKKASVQYQNNFKARERTSISSQDSDMITEEPDGKEILKGISEYSKKFVYFSKVYLFLKMRIPMVKLYHFTYIEGSIRMLSQDDHSVQLWKQIKERFPLFASIVLVLKIFLSQNFIDKCKNGGLGSSTLYLLVACHFERLEMESNFSTMTLADKYRHILHTFFKQYNSLTSEEEFKYEYLYSEKLPKATCVQRVNLCFKNAVEIIEKQGISSFVLSDIIDKTKLRKDRVDALSRVKRKYEHFSNLDIWTPFLFGELQKTFINSSSRRLQPMDFSKFSLEHSERVKDIQKMILWDTQKRDNQEK